MFIAISTSYGEITIQVDHNRPCLIYQCCNTPPIRLSGQTSIFGSVFFVSKSLLKIEEQNKFKYLQFCPKSLGSVLEYEDIALGLFSRFQLMN